MNKPLSSDILQHSMDVIQRHGGNLSTACLELGINRSSLQGRVRAAKQQGIVAGVPNPNEPAQLLSQIRRLQEDLKKAQQERLDHGMIKHKIIQLTREVGEIKPPSWLVKSDSSHSKPGVPTLFLSDLHWGEVVDGKQINNVNRYDMEIARTRLQYVAERAVHLCEIISPKLDYPGIVIPLGGDMISGNIHDELMATNEMNSMPTILDLFEALTQLIKFFRNKFEKIFLPCVTGNHGRDTHKIWAKDRHHTSFDWLLYCFLAKRFADDKNVTFLIPDGPDAHYKIYDHSYLLTHGDQFKGGDSVIGALGPLCVSPMTKILKSDLSYVEAGDLRVGDELLGFDEIAEPRGRRKFKTTEVEEVTRRELECYEIHTDDGQTTIASVDHPWLCVSGAAHAWIKTRHLRIGSHIMTLGRPWKRDTSYEAGYLAGILDGEGYLEREGRLKFTQQNNACLHKTLDILDRRWIPYRRQEKGAKMKGYEECYDVVLFNGREDGSAREKQRVDTWKLLGEVRPERIIQEYVRRSWEGTSVQVAKKTKVIGIRYVGIREVSAFTTSSRTFVGNGMLMHNTRGDHKKRSRNMQINLPYDAMICGHWHQYIQLQRLIVNGSLKGYDEYAYGNNFPYEPPQQALWLTHPKYRITYRMPVLADKFLSIKPKSWVSF